MPRVPTAQQAGLGRRELAPVAIPAQSLALPEVRVPSHRGGAALAALGGVLSGLGDKLGAFAAEEEAERRRALLAEADGAAAAAVGDLLRHPENGYLAKPGRQALLAREETLRALEAVGRRGLSGLEPALRPAYRALWGERRAEALAEIDGHARAQFGAWLDAVDLGRIRDARQAAADSGGAPEAVGRAQAEAAEALDALAGRRGWPAERRAALGTALRSRLHAAVLDRLLEREDLGRAQAYFRAAGGELDEEARRRLAPRLAEARARAAELARAAAAERLLADWRAEGLTPAEQRERAQRLRSPALAALAAERAGLAEARQAREARAANRAALAQARQAVEQGALPEQLPLAVTRHLGGPQRSALAARARRLAAGERPDSDLLLLHRLRRLVADDPRAFAGLDLYSEARDRLDEPDFAALERLQAALEARREGRAGEADRRLVEEETIAERAIADALRDAGLAPARDGLEAAVSAVLAKEARQALEVARRGAGQPLDLASARRLVSGLLAENRWVEIGRSSPQLPPGPARAAAAGPQAGAAAPDGEAGEHSLLSTARA